MKFFIRNWNKKRKRILPVVLSALIMSMCFSQTIPQTAEAAGSKKAVKTVILKARSKKDNKKTVTLKKGAKVKLTVAVNPAKAKKSVTFKTSNKKVATVSKKGVITAKNKKGTAKITVKVKGKNGKTTTTWLKVYVEPKHTWKKHTATKKVWVPNIVTVDDYERVHGAQLWRKVDDKTSVDDGPIFWFENGYTIEDFNDMCFDVMLNHGGVIDGIYYSGYMNVYKYVKTGSHTEDHGSYKTTKYVDYYYCNCGAKKK